MFSRRRIDDDSGQASAPSASPQGRYHLQKVQSGAGQYDPEAPEPTTASPVAKTETVVLPETGGPNPAAFALPTLALLVAGGIFARRLIRK